MSLDGLCLKRDNILKCHIAASKSASNTSKIWSGYYSPPIFFLFWTDSNWGHLWQNEIVKDAEYLLVMNCCLKKYLCGPDFCPEKHNLISKLNLTFKIVLSSVVDQMTSNKSGVQPNYSVTSWFVSECCEYSLLWLLDYDLGQIKNFSTRISVIEVNYLTVGIEA